MKNLITLGGNLTQSKEYRDFFEDIVVKVGEPLRDKRMSKDHVELFFDLMIR